MSENINGEKRRTVKGMFDTMLRYYIGQMKRDDFYADGSCERLYQWMVGVITKEIEQDPSRAKDYTKILEMLDRFYKVVTDEKIRDKVKQEDIKSEGFVKLYGNRILGEFKRKYDMSHKYLKGSIATIQGPYGTIKNDIEFSDSYFDAEEFEAPDDGTIKIQQTGELTYTSAFRIQGNKIMRYKVSIPAGDNKVKEYVVFSDIDIDKMKIDEEYREVVLGELLSKNNLEFSNCQGYIGTIYSTRSNLDQMKPGEEREDGRYGDYEYQATRNYQVRYTTEEISAVMEYQQEKSKEDAR